MKTLTELDSFTRAYIEAALWSSSAEVEPFTDRSFQDHGFDVDSLASETLASIEADCRDFQEAQAELLTRWYEECDESIDRAGHDFWLTRNRHGAGFWDRWNSGTPQGKIGQELTEAAHVYGEVNLYLGDDGLIYS